MIRTVSSVGPNGLSHGQAVQVILRPALLKISAAVVRALASSPAGTVAVSYTLTVSATATISIPTIAHPRARSSRARSDGRIQRHFTSGAVPGRFRENS